MTAKTRPNDAKRIVEQYFSEMRAGGTRVADLFHEDAFLLGLGMHTQGREAIRSFYAKSIAAGSPHPRLAAPLLCDGGRVAAEIYIDLAEGSTVHVVDLFRIEDGSIRSLNYFVADEPPQ